MQMDVAELAEMTCGANLSGSAAVYFGHTGRLLLRDMQRRGQGHLDDLQAPASGVCLAF